MGSKPTTFLRFMDIKKNDKNKMFVFKELAHAIKFL